MVKVQPAKLVSLIRRAGSIPVSSATDKTSSGAIGSAPGLGPGGCPFESGLFD
jgi:hypothetical protein